MADENVLYFQRGVLRIEKAKGYWFSGGGEKGAFGYYPHLKDDNGYPVYPDTQIRGDLAVAANWLVKLGGGPQSVLLQLFGAQGKECTTPLFITDMELTDDSKNEWANEPRYEVKSRIAVQDNRTAEEHMLVSFEYAFLENKSLEAQIYLGYFNNKSEIEEAARILKEAAQLLSGFGAFRSRGYGRGKVEIDWKYPMECYRESSQEADTAENMAYFLEAKTHVRNRPLNPEGAQLIGTRRSLTAAQIRGWFINTYHDLYASEWPTIEEMKSITFTDFNPTKDFVLTYPAPRTTLRKEDKTIEDMAGQDEKGSNNDYSQENLIRSKTKPLSESGRHFVNMDPAVYEVPTVIRFRNVMEGYGDFRTLEKGGLFAHEYIPAGTRFGGTIYQASPNTKFGKRCRYILKNIRPVVAGAIFDNEIRPLTTATAESKFHLLSTDLSYRRDLLEDSGNSVCIASQRGFNTANGRPRRNRIVIMAGSVLTTAQNKSTIPWSGFGEKNIPFLQNDDFSDKNNQTKPGITIPDEIRKKLVAVSRAQAGQLRELLHLSMKEEHRAHLSQFLAERLKKYDQWKKEEIDKRLLPKELLIDLSNRVSSPKVNMQEIRGYIGALYKEIQRHWWVKKKKPAGYEATKSGGRES